MFEFGFKFGFKLGLGLMLGFELGLRLWLGLGLMPTVPVYMVVDKFFPFFYNNFKHTKMFVLPLPFPPKMLALIVDIILNNSCNLLSPDEDMIRPGLRRMKIKSNEMHAVIAESKLPDKNSETFPVTGSLNAFLYCLRYLWIMKTFHVILCCHC